MTDEEFYKELNMTEEEYLEELDRRNREFEERLKKMTPEERRRFHERRMSEPMAGLAGNEDNNAACKGCALIWENNYRLPRCDIYTGENGNFKPTSIQLDQKPCKYFVKGKPRTQK